MALELYRRRIGVFLSSLATLTFIAITISVLSISIGSVQLNPLEVFKALLLNPLGVPVDNNVKSIASLRLTRTIAAFFCGASLGLAGLLMQTVTRNPLADPYIFGLSSTALTAVAIATILSPSLTVYRYNTIAIAFAGAITGYALTISLARVAGGSSLALVLAGIAVASLFSGLSHTLLYVVQNMLKTPYVYFLMGSASTVLKTDLNPLVYPSISLALLSILLFKPLNVYIYGDEYSRQLGFNPRTSSVIATSIASLATAITIAFVGVVGFIGLIAPHIARTLVGSDHRFSIPIAFLVGGIVTVAADIAVRLIAMYVKAVGELPLGVVTSMIGAPFMVYVLVKRVRR